MNTSEFEEIFESRVNLCRTVLIQKAKEYANQDDRLHNFNLAAQLNRRTPAQALWGMLTKHIISLSDMIQSGDDYSQEMWDEKIGDTLNYLFLLDAVTKDGSEPVEENDAPGFLGPYTG